MPTANPAVSARPAPPSSPASSTWVEDVNDPLTTGYAFSNAFTGHFARYTEGLGRPAQFARKNTLGLLAQDTWKIRKNLTVDIGLRVYWSPWALQSNPEASAFTFERYDPRSPRSTAPSPPPTAAAPSTPSPVRSCTWDLIGAIVPAPGDVCNTAITPDSPCKLNGVVVQNDKSFMAAYGGFRDPLPLQYDPRLGIAWGAFFGKGKTAIRTSIGTFHQASIGGNAAYNGSRLPLRQVHRLLRHEPVPQRRFHHHAHLSHRPHSPAEAPLVYQYMFGIQHEVVRGTVLDVAYVGDELHHNPQATDYNLLPYGARFDPKNADRANPPSPSPDVFLRPYIGYLDINISGPTTTTRYDSLQAQLNRRFAGRLELSGSYTYAKAFVNGYAQQIPSRLRRTLLPNDQTHVLNVSYVLDLPKGSNLVPARPAKWVLDNWQAAPASPPSPAASPERRPPDHRQL